jgi:molybdate transport system substrate-binding protein
MRLLRCVLAAGVLLGAAPAAAAPRAASKPPLRVAAAADLRYALDELVAAYRESAPGIDVRVSYGSSGSFFAQISNGAPFDLFLSADVSYPRKLVEAGLASGREVPYAVGRLALWVPEASKLDLAALGMTALLDSSVRRISIANPEHAPYGVAAEAAMRSTGVYEGARQKLVFGDNVSQAAQFVESGNADVGILALSLVLAPALHRAGRHWEVPEREHPRIEQAGVILASSRSPEAARELLALMTGPGGRAILERYGFGLPAR